MARNTGVRIEFDEFYPEGFGEGDLSGSLLEHAKEMEALEKKANQEAIELERDRLEKERFRDASKEVFPAPFKDAKSVVDHILSSNNKTVVGDYFWKRYKFPQYSMYDMLFDNETEFVPASYYDMLLQEAQSSFGGNKESSQIINSLLDRR